MKKVEQANPRGDRYWRELAPSDHSIQIYGNEDSFIDALEGFVSSGLRNRESVILISTAAHLHELEKRLRANWIDVDRARWEDRYIAVLAQETLSTFMVNGMPDEKLLIAAATPLVSRARGGGNRKMRAFGEMVALLWAQGNSAAAIELETLWSKLQADDPFPIFCAYPHGGFKGSAADSIRSICSIHSRIIPGYADA